MSSKQLILIPDLNSELLEVAFESSDAAGREVIRTAVMLGNAAKSVSGKEATPERVAWLHLWSRGLEVINGLRGILEWPSVIVLHALARSATELHLHLSLIGDVLITERSGTESAREVAKAAALRDVLCAYLALVIHSDLKHASEVEKNLEALYEPQTARDLINGFTPEGARQWQEWFGEIEELSDQEAELDRVKGARELARRVEELRVWIDKPELAIWSDRLSAMKNPNLAELLRVGSGSARGQFRFRGIEFGYSEYQLDSQVMHGTRFDSFVFSAPDGFAPRAVNHDPATAATRIAEEIRLGTLALMVFKERIF